MYQSTGICTGKQRPPIIHAYGGAKRDMARALATIAVEGWIPLAAAMVGTHDKPPMWAGTGLQPVIGATIDLKVAPAPLSDRTLRCWKRWDAKAVSGSALATWLCNVQCEFGPACEDSPQFRRVDIDMLEAARLLNESGFQFLPEKELQDVPEMEIVMSVGLRLCTLEFTPAQLSVSGLLPDSFPHHQWVQAVHLQEWKDACDVLYLGRDGQSLLRSWFFLKPKVNTTSLTSFILKLLV